MEKTAAEVKDNGRIWRYKTVEEDEEAPGENCIHQFGSAIKYFVHVVVYIMRGRGFGGGGGGGGGELRERKALEYSGRAPNRNQKDDGRGE